MEKPPTQPEVTPDHTEDAATLPPKAKPPEESATLPPKGPGADQAQLQTLSHVDAASPPTEPEIAQSVPADIVIPGYEILSELGRGGMGVVYKARHKKLGRLVALKMILAGGHAGEADLARFRTEAEAIARVKHANIIQIYEIGEREGKPYFSLEFCVGGSLAQKIAGTPLQPKEAARLVEKLARGMEAAHQEEIIHRDLKPANVLLMKDGTPKITDFGLAKKLDDVGQTQSGAIMGTPSYMAPEQAGGKAREMGPPVDIYALGAILYELLTGRPPFKAATPLDTVMQVMMNEPVSPSQLQNKTPADLETICLKCLQKDPRKRYASAQALADDLRRYQKGEPILARPVGSIERTLKWFVIHHNMGKLWLNPGSPASCGACPCLPETIKLRCRTYDGARQIGPVAFVRRASDTLSQDAAARCHSENAGHAASSGEAHDLAAGGGLPHADGVVVAN